LITGTSPHLSRAQKNLLPDRTEHESKNTSEEKPRREKEDARNQEPLPDEGTSAERARSSAMEAPRRMNSSLSMAEELAREPVAHPDHSLLQSVLCAEETSEKWVRERDKRE
jgi:hypothetical protein